MVQNSKADMSTITSEQSAELISKHDRVLPLSRITLIDVESGHSVANKSGTVESLPSPLLKP